MAWGAFISPIKECCISIKLGNVKKRIVKIEEKSTRANLQKHWILNFRQCNLRGLSSDPLCPLPHHTISRPQMVTRHSIKKVNLQNPIKHNPDEIIMFVFPELQELYTIFS